MSETVYRLHVTSEVGDYTIGFHTKAERDADIRFIKKEMAGMNYRITTSELIA
tara:strand:+ start:424 stop:582 length:159 start_codon:yes stop_codon:yes gene_type:complete